MALRRTKKNSSDDEELLDDEEEVEDDAGDEEEDEPERAFPRWIAPLLTILGLAVAAGVGAYGGYVWEKNHAKQHDVIATINQEPLTLDYLQHREDMATGNTTAHNVAQEILFLQYAKKEGAIPSDADVETKYKELSKDSTKFNQEMFRTHQSPEDVKRSLRISMARTALLTKGVTISDMDAQNYYKANIDPRNQTAQFFRPETIRIEVVVSRSLENVTKAAAELKAGQPFPAVAGKYSEDNSKANGGLLPPIKRNQPGLEKSPQLVSLIFAMKPQETVGPTKMGSGNTTAYWLIHCIDKQPAVTLPFDRVRDTAYKGMLLFKGQQVNGKKTQEALDAFQASSQINVLNNWANYTDAITAKTTEGQKPQQ